MKVTQIPLDQYGYGNDNLHVIQKPLFKFLMIFKIKLLLIMV
jgi:hypothetical protein